MPTDMEPNICLCGHSAKTSAIRFINGKQSRYTDSVEKFDLNISYMCVCVCVCVDIYCPTPY